MTPSFNIDTVDWEEVYVKLRAYAHKLMDGLGCFLLSGSGSIRSGQEDRDYAMEAIEHFLRNQDKYDPVAGRSHLNYLKLHLVRSFIFRDYRSAERRKTDRFPDSPDDALAEELLPWFEANLDQKLDYPAISAYVEERLRADRKAEDIYMGLYQYGMKRAEIIDEFEITENEYNNGVRRLDTILRTAATIFKIKSKAK